MSRRLALVVLVSLAGCSSSKGGKAVDPNAPLREKLSASKAPEPSQGQGAWLNVDRPLRLSDELKGRVVLLAFWTTSSISCSQTLPMLAGLQARFANGPFTVVGVHAGKFDAERDGALVRAAMAREGVSFPVVMDTDYFVWALYGVKGWPTLALIDTEGYVVAMESGEIDGRVLEFAIHNLLADGERRGVLAKAPPAWKAEAPPAPTGPLAFPGKVAALGGDRLAVSDSGHHRVLVLNAKGEVLQTIGSGKRGFADGDFASAAFDSPQGLAVRGDTLFVADSGNHAVRQVELSKNAVTTAVGTGELGRGQREMRGMSPVIALRSPWDVAVSGDALFIAMAGSNQVYRHSFSKGTVEPWVGAGVEEKTDGPADKAAFARPSGLAVDGVTLFVADSGSSALRQVHTATGETSTLVGQGLFTFGDADGAKADARLQFPLGVAMLGDALFVADTFNGKVKRVAKDGSVRTVATSLTRPGGLAAVGTRLLVADTDAHRLVWVDPGTGAVEPLAVTGAPAPATGVQRTAFALKRASVKPGSSTLRLLLPAPANEAFADDAPVTVVVRGVTLRSAHAVKVKDDELRIELPIDVSQAATAEVDLDAYTRPTGKAYTKASQVTLSVPLALDAGAGDVVSVPGRLK